MGKQTYLIDALDTLQARFSFKAYKENPTLQKLSDFDFLEKFSSELLKQEKK